MMAFSQGFTALTVFAVISAIVWQADGLASTTTTYTDTGCTQELSVSSVFGAFIPSEDGSYLLGDFNTCNVVFGAGAITVCDEDTEVYGLDTYSDEECKTPVLELSGEPSCVELPDCAEGGVCSTMTICSKAEPTKLTRNTFNFLATEYDDADCQNPTGKTEILSADIYGVDGVGDGSCALLGANYFHSACMGDGSVSSQTFGTDDESCSGDVYSESGSSGDTSATCSTVEVNGLFYNGVSCTTDDATVGGSSGGTADAGDKGGEEGDTPAPTGLDRDNEDHTGMPTTTSMDTMDVMEATMSPTSMATTTDEDDDENDNTREIGGGVSVFGKRVGTGLVAWSMWALLATGVTTLIY